MRSLGGCVLHCAWIVALASCGPPGGRRGETEQWVEVASRAEADAGRCADDLHALGGERPGVAMAVLAPGYPLRWPSPEPVRGYLARVEREEVEHLAWTAAGLRRTVARLASAGPAPASPHAADLAAEGRRIASTLCRARDAVLAATSGAPSPPAQARGDGRLGHGSVSDAR